MVPFLSLPSFLHKHLYQTQSNKERCFWALCLTLSLLVTVGLALGFEYIGGYLPCSLCLIERLPYYSALVFLGTASLWAWFVKTSCWVRFLFLCVGGIMACSLGLAIYHVGIEYQLWPAPTSCGVGATRLTTNANHLLHHLNNIQPPSCSQAPGHFLFLSFAGWNAVASLFYMLLSLFVASKGMLSKRKIA
ncbi:disulfide bond formation protein B [Bartonella bacilliformis]|uniref:DsbB domain protein n=2 Tax=Bartonella bacilliformis TaxID=774 RepID=A1URB7_BARBK|nr:disulfide bond formation protein B [Bartonella bacilliformis]ABM45540.1 DsbB domain protein [Bartonella bacilliformis KC583]AMG85396.1 disulfide bond formation protein B [Bartonella bacilliformis]EKS46071.1 DsbB domain-containing protein [Bartonella bacilliformis INS]EYS89167.1 hypothetical protein X472_00786 [Bartonella bacilliformis San Pedro600-02]KZN22119.1 disulfide bond formation protein DsbB [Bartonella bacilliformis]